MLQITTFRWVPEFAQGYVRDLRPRWACEEAGIKYEMRLVNRDDVKSAAYLKEQPFSQVPVLRDGDVSFFESGAMALYIGEKSEILLPKNQARRARVTAWVFAAVSSVEPFVKNYNEANSQPTIVSWAKDRQVFTADVLRKRLTGLAGRLEGYSYLEGEFSVADIMMSTVLRDLDGSEIYAEFPALKQYQERCEARPAFQRALAGQMQTFKENAPKSV